MNRRSAIIEHLEEYLGPCHHVLHERVSENIHLDVLIFAANEERPFHTAVTLGVSDGALTTPEDESIFRHVELMTYLPAQWDPERLIEHRERWWPIAMLNGLGKYVHQHKTFFGPGHSIEMEEPPVPGSLLMASLLVLPAVEPPSFNELMVDGERVIFLWALPVTEEELNLKIALGVEALLTVLADLKLETAVDAHRPCLVSLLWRLLN